MPAIGGPCLTAIQKCAQDHSSVHGNLSGEANATVLPKPLCQLAEGCARLSNAQHHLTVQGSTAHDGATQVAEIIHSLDLCITDDNGRRWWCIGSL